MHAKVVAGVRRLVAEHVCVVAAQPLVGRAREDVVEPLGRRLHRKRFDVVRRTAALKAGVEERREHVERVARLDPRVVRLRVKVLRCADARAKCNVLS